MSQFSVFAGIDVSKDHLDVHVLPEGQSWRVANDEAGCAQLSKRLTGLSGTVLVVMEATNVFWRLAATALAGAAKPMHRTYVWPYQMHGSIGPSCAVADYQDGHSRVWSGTQNPHLLRTDLALLIERSEADIDVIRMEAAGCYGRNCSDDVSADALLLSRAVGYPVRVQLTREQEHACRDVQHRPGEDDRDVPQEGLPAAGIRCGPRPRRLRSRDDAEGRGPVHQGRLDAVPGLDGQGLRRADHAAWDGDCARPRRDRRARLRAVHRGVPAVTVAHELEQPR